MAPGPAYAEITRVEVHDSGSLGTFVGREYTCVSGQMEGTVAREDGTTGRYRVPVSLYYPDRGSNGFGLVDVVGNGEFSQLVDETAPWGKRTITDTGDKIQGSDPERDPR